MKSNNLILTVIVSLAFNICLYGQFDLEKIVRKNVEKNTEKEVNSTLDKAFDEATKGTENGNASEETSTEKSADIQNNVNETPDDESSLEELNLWSKYDFVAGEKVIFEDDLSIEESGEFPSRWDLLSGSVEIASLGGENVIHFSNNNSIIFPLMDNKDFLPEVFTIEFDVFFEKDGVVRSDFYKIRFFEGTYMRAKIDGKEINTIDVSWNKIMMGAFGGKTKSYIDEKKNFQPKWKHVALAFNKRSLKVYLDQERLINIPNLGFKPKMFSIDGHYDDRYIKMSSIKNIRVNEGGKKLYDRIMEEGKFVTRGILFEVSKATINGESMGTINEIVKLMNKYPDLDFRIEGHTDSDGDDSFNQELSEKRAAAINSLLVEHGIDSERLESKGLGESKPVSENKTPEGKANNRRVEFIKI